MKKIAGYRIFILSIFFIALHFNLFAQFEINYGFKLGAGPSKLKFDEINVKQDSIGYRFYPLDEKGIGAHFGIFLRANQNNKYLQTELLYTFVIGDVVNYEKDYNGSPGNNSIGIVGHYFMQINMPLIFGLQGGPFGLQAGPVLSYLTYKDDYFYFEESDNKFSLAYHLGLEINIKNFFITARYKNNFTPVVNYAVFNNEKFDYKLKTSEFMFSIGFILGKQMLKGKD